MTSLIFVVISLIILHVTTSKLTAEFSKLIHGFGGNRNVLVVFWSIIFLPGTVIHEMSHFLVAMITGARTGRVEIFPRFIEDDYDGAGVTLGSVQTQRLNPIQGFLIGTAPFYIGIAFLVWLSVLIRSSYEASQTLPLLLQAYIFFTISNSFFPSWTDIKQVIPLVIIVIIFMLVGWLVGVNFVFSLNSQILTTADVISSVVLMSAFLNLAVIITLWLIGRVRARKS